MSLAVLKPRSLAAAIVESHRPERTATERLEAGELRVDHLWLGGGAARLALDVAQAGGLGRAGLDRVWVSATRDAGAAADVLDGESAAVWTGAARFGASVSRPRHGASEPVYRERGAAPGRVLAWCGAEPPSCGGLGVLAVDVGALEAAAILGGLPLHWDPSEHHLWRVDGSLAAGVGGADVAMRLCGEARSASWSGRVCEFSGPGVAHLAMSERLAAAVSLSDLGAVVLFPSDARTRHYLDACGRDIDWRELAGETPAGATALDLGDVEPMIAPADDASLARPLRHAAGRPVRRVVFGPAADEAELAVLARSLAERGRHADVEVVVAVGSARARASLEATGAWDALERAGVVSPPLDAPLELAGRGVSGAWVCCGVTGPARAALPAGAWRASAASAIAAAIAGQVTDPRGAGIAIAATEPDRFVAPARPEPGAGAPAEAVAERAAPRPRPMRAVVWAVVGDDCEAGEVLPRGVRGRRDAAEPGHAFTALFPGRVPARDGVTSRAGLVVAGRAFLAGADADAAAWALARAGVRAVAAESYGTGGDRALAGAGVLPLTVREARMRSRLGRGDEVEIPGMPDALEPGRPVVVRNLTRGLQVPARHPLDARSTDVWRAGGTSGYAAARARDRREGR